MPRSVRRAAREVGVTFAARVAEYKARVQQVRGTELADAIVAACSARQLRRLVVSADLPASWAPPGVQLLRDAGLSNAQLDTSDGVLTGCALGIAQTGTIVLDHGPGQGRRALTLLPDYHLCVVRAEQIVGLVPEAMAQLDAANRAGQPITGILAWRGTHQPLIEGVQVILSS